MEAKNSKKKQFTLNSIDKYLQKFYIAQQIRRTEYFTGNELIGLQLF